MQALESCFGFLMGTEIHTDSTRSRQAGGIPAVPNDLANAHSSKVAVMRRVAELPASEGASLTLGRTGDSSSGRLVRTQSLGVNARFQGGVARKAPGGLKVKGQEALSGETKYRGASGR